MKLIENVVHSAPFSLGGQVEYEKGKVASRTLAKQPGVNMTLMAFDAGEGVSTHSAPGDAVVMPSGIPHAVRAVTAFKMLLVVVREGKGK